MVKSRRGSVLMEFIIVLPIYLIFLGVAFFFGELSLHGVNMMASGDRSVALAYGRVGQNGFPSLAETRRLVGNAISVSKNLEDPSLRYYGSGDRDEYVSQYSSAQSGQVADADIRGAWSWLVAATLKDYYALTPWTRGMVMPWRVIKPDVPTKTFDAGIDDLMDPGRIGRTEMLSRKLGNVTGYAYYTLTRKPSGFSEESYRRWGTGRIVDSATSWNRWVYDEKFPVTSDNFDFNHVNRGGNQGRALPVGADTSIRGAYRRFGRYVGWSE